ncbi:FRG domain-containing protein [Burkholderia ubonensis]|uniref:FRG domain-containing protein n=1 Tax=Burkholderia ubonensis TaxID=101571 RepID=UPI00075C43B6|nr:FRG domain-containing protein [Burkholderia ubonensis]KVP28922.1 hypothetical protein WJ87_26980 [Burkholderia ubonensis]
MTACEDYRAAQSLGDAGTLADYIAKINQQINGATRYLFRGQRDASWALTPGIARHALSDPDVERAMLEEFRRRAIPYLESNHELRDADWLAIAQHHGMPTRLLDWSGSALTALWFAVNEAVDDDRPAAVWLFPHTADDLMTAEERDEPFSTQRTRLFRPRHVSRRIAAQDGWFTLHRSLPGTISYVSLDSNMEYRDRLRYVTIPRDAFASMRIQLANAGVTSAVLYPDLDGVAQYIRRTHLFTHDEMLTRLGAPSNLRARAPS